MERLTQTKPKKSKDLFYIKGVPIKCPFFKFLVDHLIPRQGLYYDWSKLKKPAQWSRTVWTGNNWLNLIRLTQPWSFLCEPSNNLCRFSECLTVTRIISSLCIIIFTSSGRNTVSWRWFWHHHQQPESGCATRHKIGHGRIHVSRVQFRGRGCL